jgi:hypothetical protein
MFPISAIESNLSVTIVPGQVSAIASTHHSQHLLIVAFPDVIVADSEI